MIPPSLPGWKRALGEVELRRHVVVRGEQHGPVRHEGRVVSRGDVAAIEMALLGFLEAVVLAHAAGVSGHIEETVRARGNVHRPVAVGIWRNAGWNTGPTEHGAGERSEHAAEHAAKRAHRPEMLWNIAKSMIVQVLKP
jgi:hypothetical protein